MKEKWQDFYMEFNDRFALLQDNLMDKIFLFLRWMRMFRGGPGKGKLLRSQERFLNDGCGYNAWWSLNEDGTIYVNGSFHVKSSIRNMRLKRIPVKFSKVNGDLEFDSCTHLESLEGSPEIVQGCFSLYFCTLLKNLVGGPKYVWNIFTCKSCWSLESLEGFPETVGTNFILGYSMLLKTLKHSPWDAVKGCYHVGDGCGNHRWESDLLEEDPNKFRDWLKSDMNIEAYLHDSRGKRRGKKFGV